jgi:ABC-2 type transport system ATP-binding protein
MIRISHLVKRRRGRTHVDDVSFDVRPGRVTGLLGPNGAGKSSTMRVLLGLDAATSGSALIGGVPYRALRDPLRTVGAMLDGPGANRGRTVAAHLTWMAQSNGIPRRRVDEVLEVVGLPGERRTRVGSLSLGMGQRLGIAAALLGDPAILVLDEPTNGLDPDGIRWIRRFLRGMADEGRTVLVSSHLMSEMEDTADDFVVIARGRVVAQGGSAEITTGFPSLESAFFALTEGGADHRSGDVGSGERA